MAIRQLPPGELEAHDFIPQAVVNLPPSYFTKAGIKFVQTSDDLDRYEGAALSLDGGPTFSLRHYKGHPEGTTTIYLPIEIDDVDSITDYVARIMRETEAPAAFLKWQRKDGLDL